MERGLRDTDIIYVYFKQHDPSVYPNSPCNILMEDNAILKTFNLSRAYVPSV